MKKEVKILSVFLASIFLSACANETNQLAPLQTQISVVAQKQESDEEKIRDIEKRVDRLDETIAKIRLELEKGKISSSKEQPKDEQVPLPPENSLPELPLEKPNEKKAAQTGINELFKEQPTSSTEISSSPTSPKALYKEAYTDYTIGKYDDALLKFKKFLDKYPQDPLADNAYYWVAMIVKEKGHKNKSLALLLSLIDKCKKHEFTSCDKAPAAYISAANIYNSMGQTNKANELYKELIKEYPNSIEAALAKTALETK